MVATIVGSTGLTGSFLIQKLLSDTEITKVLSVSRKSLKNSNPKLTEVLISDLVELASVESSLHGDLYFCCLGTTIKAAGSKENFLKVDHTAIVDFAKIAKAHRAKSLSIVSAMGADIDSMIFYNQVKGRTEKDIIALGIASLNIFRPALLNGPRREFRLAEKIVSQTLMPLSRLIPRGLKRSLLTEAETLAARMLLDAKTARPGTHILRAKDIY